MAKRSMFVGMDVHKDSIDISLAEEGRDGEVRHYGGIPGDLEGAQAVEPEPPQRGQQQQEKQTYRIHDLRNSE